MYHRFLEKKINILILGGTEDTNDFFQLFPFDNFFLIPSYAGRTSNPKLLPNSRIGGFGGEEGFKNYLLENNIDAVLDCTHPFAQRITQTAYKVTKNIQLPYWRYERPSWKKHPCDLWTEFDDLSSMVSKIPQHANCFLALGRQYIEIFQKREDISFFARMIEKTPVTENFSSIKIFYGKPLSLYDEYSFLKSNKINLLICRNAGAFASYTKIKAARMLKCPVFLLKKPTTSIPFFENKNSLRNAIIQHFFDKVCF